MNFITILLDSIVGFVRRNPITCIVLAILAVAFPPVFGFVVWAIAMLIAVAAISALVLLWRLRKVQRTIKDQFDRSGGAAPGGGYSQQQQRREGDVSVHRTSEAPAKKISDDVGEYVDFEEEKNDDR